MIAACDFKPAPKTKREPAPGTASVVSPTPAPAAAPARAPTPTAPTPTPAAPAGPIPVPPAPPGVADLDDPGQACMQLAVRVANIFIASAEDASQRAQYEQARADTVRTTAQACVRNTWDKEMRRCFFAASTRAELDACNARAPGQPTSRPTRGS